MTTDQLTTAITGAARGTPDDATVLRRLRQVRTAMHNGHPMHTVEAEHDRTRDLLRVRIHGRWHAMRPAGIDAAIAAIEQRINPHE